jgi:pyruvate ferredoxin oxidoreductase beta subunit
MGGARYVHVHVPCPLGWGSDPADTIKTARMAVESGLFPLIEAEAGDVTARYRLRKPVAVEAYLSLQRRFAHLFAPQRDDATIAAIQSIADRNIRRFNLA